jgi:hypothetical protein
VLLNRPVESVVRVTNCYRPANSETPTSSRVGTLRLSCSSMRFHLVFHSMACFVIVYDCCITAVDVRHMRVDNNNAGDDDDHCTA